MNRPLYKFLLFLIIVVICFLIPLFPGTAQSMEKEELLDNLFQGNSFFREAIEMSKKDPGKAKDLFIKSAIHFERIILQGGVRNGKLFYNTGNAYFRAGNLGKAILYYKRAFLLIPQNVNLIKNLDYARSKRIDKVEEKEQTRIFRILFFWHFETSPELRFALFIISFIISWTIITIMLFIKKPALKWGVIIPACIAALFLGSLLVDTINASFNNPGIILSHEVIARKGDSNAYEPSFQKPIHEGTEFNLIEKRRDWYHIELIDGTQCWIPEKDAELVRIE